MLIGINVSAAFKHPRTGVEEYVYQLIKHLTMLKDSQKHRFVLYTSDNNNFDFHLPNNFKIKRLKWSLPMWTQIRLSAEMIRNKPEIFFIPVHVLPLAHSKNSVVTIHGLEYEYYPKMYPLKHLKYLRWSTKYALKNARKIIAVSENTKNDLIKFYGANPEKIKVIYHGIEQGQSFNPQKGLSLKPISKPFILYVGRIELKKNIIGILEAYKILKKKYQISHKLVLAGAPGFGYNVLKLKIKNLLKIPASPAGGKNLKLEIIETGYVPEEEKMLLLKKAEMFVLPSFYEGFGIPILEAQAANCPVITSNISSMPEVAGDGAILIDPNNVEQIAEAMYKIICDKEFKKRLIKEGQRNLKRFSWQKCAQETLKALTE